MITLRKALFSLGVALASLTAFAQSASAAPIVLDNFTASPGIFGPVQGPGVLQSNGTRTLILGAPGLLNGGDFVAIGGGIFSSQSNTTSTFSTTLAYSFAPIVQSPAGSLGIDFLSLDAGSSSTNQMSLLLEVVTSTGTLSQAFLIPEGNFLQPFLLSFGGLSGVGNLNSTIGVRLTFNNINDAGVDFIVSSSNGGIRIFGEPEPEPATLATFGLMGLMGGFVARRKLKARAAVQV